MLYFTSDLHLCSDSTRVLCSRPFESTHDMNVTIINNINGMTTQGDKLYIVGDIFSYNLEDKLWKDGLQWISDIDCEVNLILGNNEERVIEEVFDGDFEAFSRECYNVGIKSVIERNCGIAINNQVVNLVHDPARSDSHLLNIHGHIHMGSKIDRYGVNVSVDICGYSPVSADMLVRMCQFATYKPDPSTRKFIGIRNIKVFEKYNQAWNNIS